MVRQPSLGSSPARLGLWGVVSKLAARGWRGAPAGLPAASALLFVSQSTLKELDDVDMYLNTSNSKRFIYLFSFSF